MKRYIPEFVKRPIRAQRTERRKARLMNSKHPKIIVIETTTRCNANCFYCGRPKQHNDMDLDLFKAIVDAVPFTKEIHPNTRGEPLLYPHIIEAVRYCKDKGKTVQTYTNGSLMTKNMALSLMSAGLDRITFSLDDCDPDRYERSRGGLNFYTVIKNLRRMVTLRDAFRFKTEIFVRATLTNLNREHQQEIIEFYSFVDQFAFMPQTEVMSYNMALEKPIFPDEPPLFCANPFRVVSIRWDGQPVLCCNDWYDNFPIGPRLNKSVSEDSIRRVLNENHRLGNQMLKGNIPAICVGCRDRRRS